MFDKVNQILIEKVRPLLQQHFGDIQLISVEDGTVKIKLIGACSNCPSANLTLTEVVESTLKEHCPEIKNIISIDETSKELMDFARDILNRRNR